jgi:hypothetical protein
LGLFDQSDYPGQIFVNERLPPALEHCIFDISQVWNQFLEIIDTHVPGMPLRRYVPNAHFAAKGASRGEFNLPGKELLFLGPRK